MTQMFHSLIKMFKNISRIIYKLVKFLFKLFVINYKHQIIINF